MECDEERCRAVVPVSLMSDVRLQLITSSVMNSNFTCSSFGAKAIIVVEKEGIFNRLVEDNFIKRVPSVIVTGLGYPPLYVRVLVHKIETKLRLPVFGLFDHGPHGMAIHLTYKAGSRRYGDLYAIKNMKLVGLLSKDLSELKLSTHPLTKRDVQLANSLLAEHPLVRENDNYSSELREMLKSNRKAELQSLYENSCRFLADEFLPSRILQRRFI
eukprot:jgi/Bigna1/53566/estExt_Genewise1Plus.C_210080